MAGSSGRRSPRVVLAVGVVLGLLYPIPLQWSGYTYFQTVGFLVLINAMLGVGWNVIGGWAGQFDFAPQVFFAIGAYTAAILFVHLGWSPWLGMLAGVLAAIGICALVTYPLTRLRGHYFAINTVAIWMIAQPIGATWEFINGSRGLFIPMQTGQGVLGSIASLQFVGRTKALGYYYVAFGLLALTLWLVHLVERGRLGFYFRAIRDDQEGAEGIGIPSRLYKVIARSITAAVFAAGGVLYGFWALAVFPEQVLDLNWSTLPIMATVVGGIGRLDRGPPTHRDPLAPVEPLDPRARAAQGLGPARGARLSVATLLELRSVTKRFGGLVANKEVSLAISAGEIVGLIGPNGAGKTTLFNCVTGYTHADAGRIVFAGADITRARPERVSGLGIARTWQLVRTFGRMTVLENVVCGALKRHARVGEARARALRLLEFTGLASREDVVAANLTLADKKRLEIARALATEPRLLLLDEAMSGLTPAETAAAVELVRRIHGELGLALCVVEHVMEVVMPLSQRVVVLDDGEKIAEGPPAEVVRNDAVIKAYLGEHYRGRR